MKSFFFVFIFILSTSGIFAQSIFYTCNNCGGELDQYGYAYKNGKHYLVWSNGRFSSNTLYSNIDNFVKLSISTDGINWKSDNIMTTTYGSYGLKIAIDDNDKIHIVYTQPTQISTPEWGPSAADVVYLTNKSDSWVKQSILSGSGYTYYASDLITIGPDEKISVFYHSDQWWGYGSPLLVKKYNGTNWENEITVSNYGSHNQCDDRENIFKGYDIENNHLVLYTSSGFYYETYHGNTVCTNKIFKIVENGDNYTLDQTFDDVRDINVNNGNILKISGDQKSIYLNDVLVYSNNDFLIEKPYISNDGTVISFSNSNNTYIFNKSGSNYQFTGIFYDKSCILLNNEKLFYSNWSKNPKIIWINPINEKFENGPEAIIFGAITNSQTGLPIQGAIVKTLTYQSGPTDASGMYVLKVPYGYGYKLSVLSPSFETVTIPDFHVPKSNPTKEVNIQLNPSAIDPEIVTVSPNPNPFTSTAPQGGVLHRYYKIINKNSGNPLPLIPVDVAGNNYLKTFKTDENGIVDIAILSNEVGDGNIGTEEVFNIISVNNISLETPWVFNAHVSSKIYSKYWDAQNYLKLGGNLLGLNMDDAKIQFGGITTLIANESIGTTPANLKINRQGRCGAEIGFKVKSPGLKAKAGPLKVGAMAEAGAGISITGIKEDEYTFPFISSNDYQTIAKYILIADGNFGKLDNTLIRLLTLCEYMFSDEATLLEAYSSDAVGLEGTAGGAAEIFAGIEVQKNTKLGVMGDVGVDVNAGVKYKYIKEENQVESSFSLAGKINMDIGAGIKFNTSNNKLKELNTKFNIYETKFQRGLRFTSVRDNNTGEITEYRLAYLSRNLYQNWEEVVEYRILGAQVVFAVQNLVNEISQISNATRSGCDISVGSQTFQTITTKVFDLIDEFQTKQTGDASISYTVSRTEIKENSAFDIELDLSATVLAANFGAGTTFEEGTEMIIEEGKWVNGKHFVNQQYTNSIPNIPIEYKSLLQSIVHETPWYIRSLMGDFKWLKFWKKSTMEEQLISENGSSINVLHNSIPEGIDSISVTSWSWDGGNPNLKSASLTSRQRSIALQNRLDAESIYGMKYGIGGFYQFEPYGLELLDTCFLTIKYDQAELGNINENSLGMYWEDKENKKWVYLASTVDTVNNSVTAPITHLSLFTLAPAMPYGEFGMHAAPDSIYADSISVTTIVSDSIFNNNHSLVKDGILFNIGLSLGRIVDSDTDPITEGIQLPAKNGIISFKVRSHHLASVAEVKANSLEGSASGSTKITYYDTIPPSAPVIISAIKDLNSVLLKWKVNREEDIAGYKGYYDTDTIPPFDGVHTVYGESSPINIGLDSLYTVSNLLNDTVYYLALSAYDVSGNESHLSYFKKTASMQVNNQIMVFSKVNIEGSSNTGLMSTTLNDISVMPQNQPYAIAPFSYSGTESVASFPTNVVDWILVELRQATSPDLATSSTILARRAAFLKSDGSIVDLDGTSPVKFDNTTVGSDKNLYVVIRHRNHLSIMSASGAIQNNGVYTYDFTTGLAQAFGGGNGYKQVGPGKFAMVAGDIDQDGNIFVSDYNRWAIAFGTTNGYFYSDLDMDGSVFVSDYNKWAINFGSTIIGGLKSVQLKSRYFSCVPK